MSDPDPNNDGDELCCNREKVYGSKEDWYKFDDNMNYHTPRPKNRMTTTQGKEVGYPYQTISFFVCRYRGQRDEFSFLIILCLESAHNN